MEALLHHRDDRDQQRRSPAVQQRLPYGDPAMDSPQYPGTFYSGAVAAVYERIASQLSR